MSQHDILDHPNAVAIVGMSGRFPQAQTLEAFWQNLCDGVSAIRFFSDEELAAAGVQPDEYRDPHYVKAGAVLDDVELLDAAFFDFTPREATITDPQHRLFLECAWEALENAGYDPQTYSGTIGVYGGVSASRYIFNLYLNPEILKSVGYLQAAIANDKDFLTTRVSYKLNLKGPSVTVQTACSTSLVAVHLAYQSLLNGECDISIAGGASVDIPQTVGYLYQEGGVASPDGFCRAFDAQGRGIVNGNGVGVVVLKRLEDALAHGDHIHAVIRGSATNNDGSAKIGYTAPSEQGQAAVIAEALALAEVDPATVTYIEAHGTATPIGDAIEIAALTEAFRSSTDASGYCAVGSVKTNIGHLDAAAGVTGLIKTVLALKHQQIPPSLHYTQPNPRIDFATSPFYVNTSLAPWQPGDLPRRAGVSSFGIGGTNAHVVLEEAPTVEPSGPSRPWQLLLLSAKTSTALEAATDRLAQTLVQPDHSLADVAYTMQVGRSAFKHRRMLVCRDTLDASQALQTRAAQRLLSGSATEHAPSIAWMFPGLGEQYVGMAQELYEREPTFRTHVDQCVELLRPLLGRDLREVLFPTRSADESPVNQSRDLRAMVGRADTLADESAMQLNQTVVAQPALFVIEYALAQLWQSWGIQPQALIGFSIGEYVAACLAGVFSLPDALTLVARRAQMIQELPGGAMLAVPLPEQEVRALLNDQLDLVAVNGAELCIVGGPDEAIEALEHQLAARATVCRRLRTTHAFHSTMMTPIADAFTALVQSFELSPPTLPFVSNVTGTWITAAEATDPHYWTRHLCQTVRFADGLQTLWQEPGRILLEIGPGHSLTSTALQNLSESAAEGIVLPTLRHAYERQSDTAFALTTLGQLWLAGIAIDWDGFYAHERRQRVPLPTYPFERQRYWLDRQHQLHDLALGPRTVSQQSDPSDGLYTPSWKRSSTPLAAQPALDAGWLVFVDESALSAALPEHLAAPGQTVITVAAGSHFAQLSSHAYTIDPWRPEDYRKLIGDLRVGAGVPQQIVHLWSGLSAAPDRDGQSGGLSEPGGASLLCLAQALAQHHLTVPIQILIVSRQLQEVTGDELLSPEQAAIIGARHVIPQEYPNITCRSIDLLPAADERQQQRQLHQLLAELRADSSDMIVAYRGAHRWVQTFDALPPTAAVEDAPGVVPGGSYLIVGGLEESGWSLTEQLAATSPLNLALVERLPLPERATWAEWLSAHDEQDRMSISIRRVQTLEAAGVTVLLYHADITSLEQMDAALTRASEVFGEIRGVVYAAGIAAAGGFVPVSDLSQDEYHAQIQQVMTELGVLERLLDGRSLDFCLIVSSLAAVLGGLGLTGYTAAAAVIDAFTARHNQAHPQRWICIDWDRGAPATVATQLWQRVLANTATTRVVVSTADLSATIAAWITRSPLSDTTPTTSTGDTERRSGLRTAYVAPTNEVEQRIAEIWQDLLGMDQVGIHDNFFQLGGASLLGIQLISRLRQDFQVELPLRALFEMSTVAELALLVEDALIAQIEGLSDDGELLPEADAALSPESA